MEKTFRDAPLTWILIIINVVVFLLFNILLPNGSTLRGMGAVSTVSLADGEWWTLLTSMFLHSGIMHLLCNMFTLYFLGMIIEKVLGTKKFAIIYFLSGLAGGLTYVGVNFITGDYTGALGASGAIFGLFGAYAILLLKENKQRSLLPFPVGAEMLAELGGLLLLNIVVGLMSPGVANTAHLGGLVCGFIVGFFAYNSQVKKIKNFINNLNTQGNNMPQPNQPYQQQSQQYQQPRNNSNNNVIQVDPNYFKNNNNNNTGTR